MIEEVSPSLRAAIEAAWPAENEDAPPEATQAEQPRGDDGKFAAKEEPAAEPEAVAPVEDDDYDEGVGLDRETWKLTPAQARERAKALAKEAKEAAERARQYEPLEGILAPRRDALRASFGNEAQALEQLFHLSDWAGRDFPGFVRHLAQQRGVDLRTLVPQQEAPQQAQPQTYDEIVARARDEARRAAAEEYQQREIARSLSEFDANTAYEFRHDPEVRKVMGGLLQSGAASDLPTAYQMAVKVHPVVSAKLAERESAERAKRDAEDRAKRDREKAAAAVSVRGAPGTAVPSAAPPPTTVRDAIMRAMDAGAGRV
ncbi:MAG TPA: hypothetical protein VGN96_11195 [Roseococcus sp.]|jgi:hypothetical protein|nr:hypothetical protein [Roseococcus sp.]